MKSILLILFFAVTTSASAQSLFKDLTVVQFGDSMLINWTLTAGSTCFDMHLKRAGQDTEFEDIFTVGGVCGGASDQYYDYVDNQNLVSGTTYQYFVSASNGIYTSETVEILYVNAGDMQLFVYPNPTQTAIQVTVDNSFTPSFFVELFSVDGKLLQQTKEVNNLFTINTVHLLPSSYLLKITTEDGDVLAQQFIVQ
ncbi:MAG: T9SS type A sorting domain-containing protein [Chitinophagales bacterium]|jgi:hypothetical protein|nr:T9SS type A sorting domain-containing protein [Bacteroidota bacterium]MBK9504365.1 T9SS type A sorting domain-containing protein [Bacteroidota bacterium]MBK9556975.1 T9SS type A sorting domain-containing protein [Bacteroidota bacterium]MBL0280960.1 T9SS type A sorting domain-containing protein [Bacteroidota bacterium]MBP8250689.1 T9SS type A sorting domain-containing protein [Chitinophagales bacterium]